jgi:hypothetical protein
MFMIVDDLDAAFTKAMAAELPPVGRWGNQPGGGINMGGASGALLIPSGIIGRSVSRCRDLLSHRLWWKSASACSAGANSGEKTGFLTGAEERNRRPARASVATS